MVICMTTVYGQTIPIHQGIDNSFIVGKNFQKSSLIGHVYLLDTGKNVSIENIKNQQASFRLLKNEIPTRMMDSRFQWIRYGVHNESNEVKNLVADLRNNEFNDLCFYVVNSDNKVVYGEEHYNRLSHLSKKPIQSRFFSFPLKINPKETVTVYWKLYRKEGMMVLPIGLYDREQFLSFNTIYNFFLYISLGVFAFIFLLSFLLFVFTKYRLLILYAGYTLFYGLMIACMEGFLTQYFPLNSPFLAENTKNVFVAFLNVFLILFTTHFLEIKTFMSNWVYPFCIALSVLVLLFGIFLMFTPFTFLSTVFLSAISAFDMLLVLYLIIHSLRHRKNIAFLYLIAITPLFFSTCWLIVTYIFDLNRTLFYYQSLPFLAFFEVIVLGIVLGYKLINDRNRYLAGLNVIQKQFTSSIVQTQEEERQRIAADLHDGLGGTLTTIRRRLADLREQIKNRNIEKELDELDPLIQKSSEDLRRISHNLMPPEFERIGFANSLKQFVHKIPSQPTTFQFMVSGDVRKLQLDVELNAYRIVSEMVQNIFKHAHATRASVQLLYHSDFLRVVIKDNGIGDNGKKSQVLNSGMGLKNSKLRASYIGADLRRESGEAGTFIILDVPYHSITDDTDEPNQDTPSR